MMTMSPIPMFRASFFLRFVWFGNDEPPSFLYEFYCIALRSFVCQILYELRLSLLWSLPGRFEGFFTTIMR
jgi:hypothetical protein